MMVSTLVILLLMITMFPTYSSATSEPVPIYISKIGTKIMGEKIRKHMLETLQEEHVDVKNEDEEYYFFILHDYNSNDMLDGNELLKAYTDFGKIDNENVAKSEIIDYIDYIFEHNDLNNDGQISWDEYLRAQKPVASH